jgi:hypothetical protein
LQLSKTVEIELKEFHLYDPNQGVTGDFSPGNIDSEDFNFDNGIFAHMGFLENGACLQMESSDSPGNIFGCKAKQSILLSTIESENSDGSLKRKDFFEFNEGDVLYAASVDERTVNDIRDRDKDIYVAVPSHGDKYSEGASYHVFKYGGSQCVFEKKYSRAVLENVGAVCGSRSGILEDMKCAKSTDCCMFGNDEECAEYHGVGDPTTIALPDKMACMQGTSEAYKFQAPTVNYVCPNGYECSDSFEEGKHCKSNRISDRGSDYAGLEGGGDFIDYKSWAPKMCVETADLVTNAPTDSPTEPPTNEFDIIDCGCVALENVDDFLTEMAETCSAPDDGY